MKFLTIVTINRNNADGLEQTIHSVAQQAERATFEYVVIDGASTDRSVDVLRQHAPELDFWLSEPDRGIYNAMNKSLRYVHGEHVLFLNSGDTLAAPDVVQRVAAQGLRADLVFAHWRLVEHGTPKGTSGPTTPIRLYDLQYNSQVCHQATFTRTSVLRDQGGYDERYRYAADTIFLMQALVLGRRTQQLLPVVVADYDTTGVSATNDAALHAEHDQSFGELFPALVEDYRQMHRWRRFAPRNLWRHLRWRLRHV
jgi:glycosyltransferase involved in cell wall biosynthesis